MAKAAASGSAASLSLELPRDIAAVEKARLALAAYLEPFSVEPRVMNRIEVVLEELVSNVARHASKASLIRMDASADKHEVRVEITDDGAAFNPLDQDDPEAFEDLENARLGGLGIPLIRRLTKSARYSRSEDRNRVAVAFALI